MQPTRILLLTLGETLATGCILSEGLVPSDDHCVSRSGNAWCVSKYGNDKPYCTRGVRPCRFVDDNNDGCMPSRPADSVCYSPCGMVRSLSEDPGIACDGFAGEESTSTTSDAQETSLDLSDGITTEGGPLGSGASSDAMSTGSDNDPYGDPLCIAHEDCTSEDAPACKDGICVPCDTVPNGDAACTALGVGTDVCGDDGVCVQCNPTRLEACEVTSPICVDGTCTPCTAHGQCPAASPGPDSAGCVLSTGACLPTEAVVHVDGDGERDHTTVTAALSALGDAGTIILHERDKHAPYAETVTLDGAQTIAILAASDERPILQGIDRDPGLTVSTGAAVFVERLAIQDSDSEGVRLDGGVAWLDRTVVSDNSGGGVQVQAFGELVLRNSFVSGPNDLSAVQIDGGNADVIYTSIGGGALEARAMVCTDASAVRVRNSLLLARGDLDAIDCANATISHSAIMGAWTTGTDNVTGIEVEGRWFEDYNRGDFRLKREHPFDGVARWQLGDPRTDIDGAARPGTDGSADVAGAHLPVTN